MSLRALAAAILVLTSAAVPAAAIVHPGDVAPNFTKQRLDHPAPGQTTPVSLYDYAGKVVVLFILGYS
jgi:hypothetical protein